MADPGYETIDALDNRVKLATAVAVVEQIVATFGAVAASPAANTIGARLVSMIATLGAPGDAAGGVTGNTSILGLLRAMLVEMKSEVAAAITAAQLPTTIGPKAATNSLSIIESTGSTLANQTKQDEATAAIRLVGTRGYGVPLTSFAYSADGTKRTVAITAGEIYLKNRGTGRVFYALAASPGVAATVNDLSLEPGQETHIRVTSGHVLNAIKDPVGGVDGFLNIIPVAS